MRTHHRHGCGWIGELDGHSMCSPLHSPDAFKVVMDRQEFESAHYQRVYQYLRRHVEKINLDRFSYIDNVEGNPVNCLEIILR